MLSKRWSSAPPSTRALDKIVSNKPQTLLWVWGRGERSDSRLPFLTMASQPSSWPDSSILRGSSGVTNGTGTDDSFGPSKSIKPQQVDTEATAPDVPSTSPSSNTALADIEMNHASAEAAFQALEARQRLIPSCVERSVEVPGQRDSVLHLLGSAQNLKPVAVGKAKLAEMNCASAVASLKAFKAVQSLISTHGMNAVKKSGERASLPHLLGSPQNLKPMGSASCLKPNTEPEARPETKPDSNTPLPFCFFSSIAGGEEKGIRAEDSPAFGQELDRNGDLQNGSSTPTCTGTLTMMIKNIPCACTHQDVLDVVNVLGFDGKFDFFHLPQRRSKTIGYAFIRFPDPDVTEAFVKTMTGYHFKFRNSSKVVSIVPAHIQGPSNCIDH